MVLGVVERPRRPGRAHGQRLAHRQPALEVVEVVGRHGRADLQLRDPARIVDRVAVGRTRAAVLDDVAGRIRRKGPCHRGALRHAREPVPWSTAELWHRPIHPTSGRRALFGAQSSTHCRVKLVGRRTAIIWS